MWPKPRELLCTWWRLLPRNRYVSKYFAGEHEIPKSYDELLKLAA